MNQSSYIYCDVCLTVQHMNPFVSFSQDNFSFSDFKKIVRKYELRMKYEHKLISDHTTLPNYSFFNSFPSGSYAILMERLRIVAINKCINTRWPAPPNFTAFFIERYHTLILRISNQVTLYWALLATLHMLHIYPCITFAWYVIPFPNLASWMRV